MPRIKNSQPSRQLGRAGLPGRTVTDAGLAPGVLCVVFQRFSGRGVRKNERHAQPLIPTMMEPGDHGLKRYWLKVKRYISSVGGTGIHIRIAGHDKYC